MVSERWLKKKAYIERRADDLEAEMRAAIEEGDRERFRKAWETASIYMTSKRRRGLQRECVAEMAKRRGM